MNELTIFENPQFGQLRGRLDENASPRRAGLLSALTGSDIRIWFKGGSPTARRAAVAAWAAKQEGKA